MVACALMVPVDYKPAVDALEAEAARLWGLREDLFGDGDTAGAKASGDLALAYRTAAEFLRRRTEGRPKR